VVGSEAMTKRSNEAVRSLEAIGKLQAMNYDKKKHIKELEQVLWSLDLDNHYWSKRPCQTCQEVTDLLKEPFGCIKKARKG
jgi:hypothetical protein